LSQGAATTATATATVLDNASLPRQKEFNVTMLDGKLVKLDNTQDKVRDDQGSYY
jgi:hypothetical protein